MMDAKTIISRRSLFGAALALGICGVPALMARSAKASSDDGISLLDELEAYESSNFVDNVGSFTMAGDTYTGVTMSYDSYALYNLKGNYSELRFTLGHVDKSQSANLAVYLDGNLYKEYTVTENDLPTVVQIPLSGVQVLRLEGSCKYNYNPGVLGIANPVVFTNESNADVIPDGSYEAEVIENGSPVTLKVTISNGLVSSLDIDSTSDSASIVTLHEALGRIISANSVEPISVKESGALLSTE